MNSKKFIFFSFFFLVLFLRCIATPIIVIDPFFHYHKPLEQFNYTVKNQRYFNDGIIKNFDYDAMITGTSMTENFSTSDLDAWYGTKSIKVPFAGASWKEIDRFVKKAADENDNLKLVVRGLDFVNLYHHKDYMEYDANLYPEYLYDNNIFNDVKYFFNKEVLFDSTSKDVIEYTRGGGKRFNFDEYSAWYDLVGFGTDVTLASYERPEEIKEMRPFSEADRELVYGNVTQNIIETAKSNPDVEFYYYFTPYSIIYFDREYRDGKLAINIDSAEYATQLILEECDNIKLFSFFEYYDIICNLDRYKDIIHHDQLISARILRWMKEDQGLLTKDNYKEHYENIRQFYLKYDYDDIFK